MKESPNASAGVARPNDRALLILRTSAFLFIIGWGLWLTGRLGTHTGAWLLVFGGWEHVQIGPNERKLGWLILALSPLLWLPGGSLLALAVGILVAADAWMGRVVGGFAFSLWTPGAHAGRYLPLIALFVWEYGRNRGAIPPLTAEWMLRLALVVVFAIHGLEAWLQHPGFTDYLIGTVETLLGWEINEDHAFWILRAIAIVDLAVASALLFSTHASLILWLAFWGVVTALARVTTHGSDQLFEVLLRSGHYLGPLALYSMVRTRKSTPGGDPIVGPKG